MTRVPGVIRSTFHSRREGDVRSLRAPWVRLWLVHNRHQLPTPLNALVRNFVLPHVHRVALRFSNLRADRRAWRRGVDEYGDPVAPRDHLVAARHSFSAPPLSELERAFERTHEQNEALRNADGTWSPHRFSPYYGKGITLEELAARIVGYLDAHDATGERLYLERALVAGDRLLERQLGDGHFRLQGHTSIDVTYTFAGLAALRLLEVTRETRYLRAAVSAGERIAEYHLAGSINHAVLPALLLARLYESTGLRRLLAKAHRRVRMTALAFQLPYGGWDTHDSWTWYHALITRSLIETYVATPFVLEHYSLKDRLAEAITAALNRMILAQQADGRLKAGRGDLVYEERDDAGVPYLERQVSFDLASGFTRRSEPLLEPHHFELDVLLTASELLCVPGLDSTIFGVMRHYVGKRCWSRPEFDTLALGHALRYARRRGAANPQDRVEPWAERDAGVQDVTRSIR